MKFVDEIGNILTQEEKEAMDYTAGRFLQDEQDSETYRWSPWDAVEPREEEQRPQATQLDAIEAQTMYTAIMTDKLLPEEG